MAEKISSGDLRNDSADSQSAQSPSLTLSDLNECTPQLLAQALAQQLAIPGHDWHRLNRDRTVRAKEQTAAALVYLLKGHPEEALPRLTQAVGWLDKTLSAPPCPTHGERRNTHKSAEGAEQR